MEKKSYIIPQIESEILCIEKILDGTVTDVGGNGPGYGGPGTGGGRVKDRNGWEDDLWSDTDNNDFIIIEDEEEFYQE